MRLAMLESNIGKEEVEQDRGCDSEEAIGDEEGREEKRKEVEPEMGSQGVVYLKVWLKQNKFYITIVQVTEENKTNKMVFV